MLSSTPRIALLACAVIGLGFSAIGRAADPEKPLPLAEVHTWGDLLAQKPVTLQIKTAPSEKQDATSAEKKPLSFRLGIDRTHAKLYGTVVLYCLAQGNIGQMDGEQPHSDPSLGPFLIDVQGPLKIAALKDLKAIVADRYMMSHSNALYIQTVPLNQKGFYTITLQQAVGGIEGHYMAMVKVSVPSELETPWSPWMEPNGNSGSNAQPAETEERYSEMEVSNPSSRIALPNWDGAEPIFLDKLPDKKLPLPEFIPDRPDAGIQLTLKGSTLIVKLDEELSVVYPDVAFLTRWWVNNKPFIPKLEFQDSQRNGTGAAGRVKEVHFVMEFHPEVLGVKKGDRVGVQLLYCLGGWEYVGVAQMAQAQEPRAQLADKSEDMQIPSISRLSNRINFIYSGDPKSIAQP